MLDRIEGEAPWSRGPWKFPDVNTFVLPLGTRSMWIRTSPADPRLEIRTDRLGNTPRGSTFQLLLEARAQGAVTAIAQQALDRVFRLEFAGHDGFVRSGPVTLHVELAGRNSNLILTDADGTIIGVQREVPAGRNRYRQLLPGLTYRPPPPYARPDPRELGAEQISLLLAGRPIRDLRQLVDGVGPVLVRAVAAAAELPADEPVTGREPGLTAALQRLLEDPAGLVQAAGTAQEDVRESARQEERGKLLAQLRPPLQKQLELLHRRLNDIGKLEEAAAGAASLREDADLLTALRPVADPGSASVTVTDWAGTSRTIALAPGKDAVQTAMVLYERARRHEQRLRRARALEPEIIEEADRTEKELDSLGSLSLPELRQRAAALTPPGRFRTEPGMRVEGPHGFTVIIGRNARENDTVTFRLAKSRDVWLHVQGYRGSHVIVQAGNREVPFDTILFAARLAAGHSEASGGGSVPVDYTLRKNVWRPKGAAPGAVHFSSHKTVQVEPLARAQADTAEER